MVVHFRSVCTYTPLHDQLDLAHAHQGWGEALGYTSSTLENSKPVYSSNGGSSLASSDTSIYMYIHVHVQCKFVVQYMESLGRISSAGHVHTRGQTMKVTRGCILLGL